jgi:hypothetical protein
MLPRLDQRELDTIPFDRPRIGHQPLLKNFKSISLNFNQCSKWIFSSNKSVPVNSKKVFKASRLPKNEEIGGILYLAAKNFQLLSKIKNKK